MHLKNLEVEENWLRNYWDMITTSWNEKLASRWIIVLKLKNYMTLRT